MEYEIRKTPQFDKWFLKLKDRKAKVRIQARLDRVAEGNLGDVKSVDTDIFEMRFFFDGGYRIYYTQRDNVVILLLNGGNKDTQQRDIKKVKQTLQELDK